MAHRNKITSNNNCRPHIPTINIYTDLKKLKRLMYVYT